MKKTAIIICLLGIILLNGDLHAASLGQEALSKKREGWYPAGLPLVNYSSDEGFGYGLKFQMFNNGKREDPYFDRSPYFYNLSGLFFNTTNGSLSLCAEADMPYFMSTRFRIKTGMEVSRMLNAGYYGVGPEETDRLRDSAGKTYADFSTYYRDFLIADRDEPADYKYDRYTMKKILYRLNGAMDITERVKVLTGFQVTWTDIDPWGGRSFDVKDSDNSVDASGVTANPTRLELDGRQDQDGWINFFRIGIGYDTRDHEVDPSKGWYIDYTALAGASGTGSDYSFIRNTFAARCYVTPVPPLTLAMRAVYTSVTGDLPFHQLGSFVFLLDSQYALGNNRTLRGYPSQRFIGNTMTNANIEARVRVLEVTPRGQRFELKLVGFVDTGSVFNRAADPLEEWDYYHTGYGGGFTLVWNQTFVIHCYYGVSAENRTMSVDFGHAI